MTDKTRVAIVVSHPIQHFVHLYRGLSNHPGIELLVIYATDIGVRDYYDRDMGVRIAWKTDLLSGYSSVFLPEKDRIQRTGLFSVNNPSVVGVLEGFGPQVVQLHGYAQLTLLRALLWCRRNGVPALLWSDSSLLFQRRALKSLLKKWLLGILLRQFAGVLTVGDNNESYYRHYGVVATKMFRCPFTVDEVRSAEAYADRARSRKEWRVRYGIPEESFLLLFVGKFIPLKRPRDILEALLKIKHDNVVARDIAVFFAGDGMLRAELEEFAGQHCLPAVFGGFINVDELPWIYAMADALVFTSDREAYGLAAREAVRAGLPLIVSDQIGCVGYSDAARPNVNALVYAAGDIRGLAEAVAFLAEDPELSRMMGAASLRTAGELSLSASVQGFVRAVAAALGKAS